MMQALSLPNDEGAVAAALHPISSAHRTLAQPLTEPNQHKGFVMPDARGAHNRDLRGRKPRNLLSNTDVAKRLRTALQDTYGEERSAAKKVAEDSGQSPRAAENWLSGDNPMSLTAFLNAFHNNAKFQAHARKLLLMEREIDPDFQAALAQFITVVQRS